MTTTFLVLSLFLPRLTLFGYYLTGNMPPNPTPFAADVLGGIFMPRVLISYWLFLAYGPSNIWFILHAVSAFVSIISYSRSSVSYTKKEA